jgi:hypothetical protein
MKTLRNEYEVALKPFTPSELARTLPLAQRVWQQAWVRKSVILILLAAPRRSSTGSPAASCWPRYGFP